MNAPVSLIVSMAISPGSLPPYLNCETGASKKGLGIRPRFVHGVGMPDRSRTHKRPRDPNQLGKLIVDLSTGQIEEPAAPEAEQKNAAAVALGRLGGLKGGTARAKNMSARQRSIAARKAAKARWKSQD